MKRLLPALIGCALALAGCVTLDDRDSHFLQLHGVSGPVYEKMLHHEPLSLEDIIFLSQRGIPGRFIVHYLRPTYAVYKLSAGDVMRLRSGGVSEGVIRYLSATPGMFSPGSQPLWYQDDALFDDYYCPSHIGLHRGFYHY